MTIIVTRQLPECEVEVLASRWGEPEELEGETPTEQEPEENVELEEAPKYFT